MKFPHYKTACILAAIGFAGSGILASSALAKRRVRPSPSPTAQDLYQLIPVDQIQSQLDQLLKKNLKKTTRKGANKTAHTLSIAYDSLMNHHNAEARALAKTVQKDELLGDYAHWIEGSACQEDARKGGAALAQEAFNQFQAVELGDPYSSLVHLAPRQVAVSELIWAQSLPPGKLSVKHFQNSFERLTNLHALSEVLPQNIQSFAVACHKSPNNLCSVWIEKLASTLPKESAELASVLKYFPDSLDHPKTPPSFSRTTQTYKAADLDTVAFEDAIGSLRGDKISDGINKLKGFLDDFPKSTYRHRARFFLAEAYFNKHQKDDANRMYDSLQKDAPLTFYGLLSTLALGKPINNSIDKAIPTAAMRDAFLTPGEVYRLNRAELLLSEGAGDLASLELRTIPIRAQQSSPFLMYLAILNHRAHDYPMVFQLLSELVQRGYSGVASEFGLKLIFPVMHFDLIRKYSNEEGLDPILVMSLIKQESAFDVKANSSSGASGLMQLMPFTAVETVPGITREQLIEAEMNIRAGTKYLSKLMDRFKGNAVLAVAAYNAGPGAVDRWVREGIQEKRSMMDFIEAIPFKETREYVEAIMRNYYWYSKIVSHSQPVTLSYFWKPYRELNHDIGIPQQNAVNTAASPIADVSDVEDSGDDDLEQIAKESPSPSPSPLVSPSPITNNSSSPAPSPSEIASQPSSSPSALTSPSAVPSNSER